MVMKKGVWDKSKEKFAIDMSSYKHIALDLSNPDLSKEDLTQLQTNIQLKRDALIFFTALAGAKGIGGHTGGAYDIVPEEEILEGLIRGKNDIYPYVFDSAGHRVASKYLRLALNDTISLGDLLHHREAKSGLPGHPEKDVTPGVIHSAARLGHAEGDLCGVSLRHKDKKLVSLGSDGSLQECYSLGAIRAAGQLNLPIKWFIDDNNVTISGHPSDYMNNYNLEKVISSLGVNVTVCDDAENLASLYKTMFNTLKTKGPVFQLNKRVMAPGIEGVENTTKAHDVIATDAAINYLSKRGYTEAVNQIKQTKKANPSNRKYFGSGVKNNKPRDYFGKVLCEIITDMKNKGITTEELKQKILVVDNDLEGSCGIHHVRKNHPEVYFEGGIDEVTNFSLAAGFGCEKDSQGVFATFSAFNEMLISQISMARLNKRNVLAHFSHAGVDDMADNEAHFGLNNHYVDSGIEEHDNTKLYMPCCDKQMEHIVKTVFDQEGLRFIFSTRSAVPEILAENGKPFFSSENGYEFEPGKDEIIRDGKTEKAGYIVAYGGDSVYRALDAVERMRKEGIDVGLINKPTLNVIDEDMMEKLGNASFVLVVEGQNYKTGLGSRFGTQISERGHNPKYAHIGIRKHGIGGLEEQVYHQGLDSDSIIEKAKELL